MISSGPDQAELLHLMVRADLTVCFHRVEHTQQRRGRRLTVRVGHPVLRSAFSVAEDMQPQADTRRFIIDSPDDRVVQHHPPQAVRGRAALVGRLGPRHRHAPRRRQRDDLLRPPGLPDHLTPRLPEGWHREHEWLSLLTATCGPPASVALTSPEPVHTPNSRNGHPVPVPEPGTRTSRRTGELQDARARTHLETPRAEIKPKTAYRN